MKVNFRAIFGAVLAAALAAAAVGPVKAGPRPSGTAEAGSVPDGILYTGTLSQNGIPVVGSKEMTFKLFDASTGGSSLWSSAQTVTFEAGRFSAVLPVSTGALSGGAARWLEISVEGTALSPREALTSHPYALVARTVEGSLEVSGGGLSVSSAPAGGAALFVSSQTGRVGIGTSAPASRLDVEGDIRSTGSVTAVRFDAAAGVVTGSAFTVGATALAVSASGAGLGTAQPDQRLSVQGSVSQTGLFVSSGAGPNVFLGSVAIGTSVAQSRLTVLDGDIRMTAGSAKSLIFPDGTSMNSAGGGITTADSVAHPADANAVSAAGKVLLRTAGADKVTVLATGQVGVANAAPAVLLDVSTSARFGSGTARSGFSPGGLLELAPGTTISASGTLSLSTEASSALTTVPALFIDAAGRVGLATGTPAALLHVFGDARADGALLLGSENIARAVSASLLEFGSQNAVDLQLVAGSASPAVYVAGTGMVGFATAVPRGLLHVGGGELNALVVGASALGIGTSNPTSRVHVSSGIISAAGATPSLRVGDALTAAGGRVGIGATNPSALFQVAAGTLTARQGRVGVATLLPAADLDVAGIARFGAGAVWSTFTAAGDLQVPGDATGGTFNGGVLLANPMSSVLTLNGSPALDTANAGLTISTSLFVSAGKVGIGTTMPGTGLHVSSSMILVDGTGGGLYFDDSTFAAASGKVGLGTRNPAALLHLSSGTLTLDGLAPAFSVGQTTFVVAVGKVGIGTSRPAARLHASSGVFTVDGSGAGLQVAGTALVALGGKVGLGTSAPALTLDANGAARFGTGSNKVSFLSAGGVELPSGSTVPWAGTISLSTAASAAATGTPALFVDRSGRAGFGTAAPNALAAFGPPLAGTISTFMAVNAGTLAAPAGSAAGIANFRFTAGANNAALALRGKRRAASPSDATTASLGLVLEADGLEQGASVWLTAGGLVGVGTAAPQGRLHLHGGDLKISTTTGSRGVIFADGTTQTRAAGSAQWVTNQDHLFAGNLGYIGMGTTAPQAKLDIGGGKIRLHPDASVAAPATQSTARIDVGLASILGDCPINASYLYYDSGAGSWRSTTSNRAGYAWGACGTDVWSLSSFAPTAGSAGTLVSLSTRLTVTSAGKVGIGTTNPAVNLGIEDSGGPALSLSRDSSNVWFASLPPAGSNRFSLRAGTNNEPDEKLSILTDGKVGFGTTAPQSLLSVTGGIAVGSYAGANAPPSGGLIVSGRVGVGLTNPGVALDVTGTQASGIRYLRGARDGRISLVDTADSWSLSVGWFGNGDLVVLQDSGSEANRLYLQQGGNVGVGTTAPFNRLSVLGSASVGTYAGASAAPTNSIIVSGSVGVGTSNPVAKLHVVGAARATDSSGNIRLWGLGRPGTFRYGTAGIESGLCQNGSVRFGLSRAAVRWAGAAAACPAGTWVCTRAERGTAACDTARPDTACDGRDGAGACADYPSNNHFGWFSDFYTQIATHTVSSQINELGLNEDIVDGQGEDSDGVWCCSN